MVITGTREHRENLLFDAECRLAPRLLLKGFRKRQANDAGQLELGAGVLGWHSAIVDGFGDAPRQERTCERGSYQQPRRQPLLLLG